MKSSKPIKTIRRITTRLNNDDSDFIITLCNNTSLNESEAMRLCMYITRELLQSKGINVHVKNTFLQASYDIMSPNLKSKVVEAINKGEKFDQPNPEKTGWHKCINIFQGIINIRQSIRRKKVNRLG